MKATNSYSIFTNRGFLFVLPSGAKYDLFSSEVFNSIDCADDYIDTICETSNVMYMKRGIWAMSANERILDLQNSIKERYI